MSLRSTFSLALALALSASVPGAQVLYSTDFESDDGGFAPTASNDWEHGVPTSGPGAAHSGTQCWGTKLDGPVSTTSTQRLTSPTIDASSAAATDGLLVSWWQFFDEPASFANAYVTAAAGPIPAPGALTNPSGTVFGRRLASTELSYSGWRRVAVRLGPNFATATFRFQLQYAGGSTDGWYVDDFTVEVLRATTIAVEDFETGTGGFTGTGSWEHGVPTCFPPAFATGPPSGTQIWGADLSLCRYPNLANDLLTSPVLDFSPFANRREAYVLWNRMVVTEAIADGVHHEISFDGGSTWEVAAGSHGYAFGDAMQNHVGFGWVVDPAAASSFRLRFRMKSDASERDIGMWLDDFEIAVPEDVLGTGANPRGSLRIDSGAFALGSPVTLAVDDPGGSFSAGSIGLVSIALAPDANLPLGTSVPGLGMAAPGAGGDALIDFSSIAVSKFGSLWAPGSPSLRQFAVPNDNDLVDLELWLQASLIDLSGPSPRIGLTTGLYERITP